jgi:hypothetical protein
MLFIGILLSTLIFIKFFSSFFEPVVKAEVRESARYLSLQIRSIINTLVTAPVNMRTSLTLPAISCEIRVDNYTIFVKAKNSTYVQSHTIFYIESPEVINCNPEGEKKIFFVREENRIIIYE